MGEPSLLFWYFGQTKIFIFQRNEKLGLLSGFLPSGDSYLISVNSLVILRLLTLIAAETRSISSLVKVRAVFLAFSLG